MAAVKLKVAGKAAGRVVMEKVMEKVMEEVMWEVIAGEPRETLMPPPSLLLLPLRCAAFVAAAAAALRLRCKPMPRCRCFAAACCATAVARQRGGPLSAAAVARWRRRWRDGGGDDVRRGGRRGERGWVQARSLALRCSPGSGATPPLSSGDFGFRAVHVSAQLRMMVWTHGCRIYRERSVASGKSKKSSEGGTTGTYNLRVKTNHRVPRI